MKVVRGKGSYNRPGNKRFRVITQKFVPEYTKLDQSIVVNSIAKAVRQQNNGHVRFVKYDKRNGWFK